MVFSVSSVTAEVPESSIQYPGWLQMWRICQIVSTLRMKAEPFTVYCYSEEKEIQQLQWSGQEIQCRHDVCSFNQPVNHNSSAKHTNEHRKKDPKSHKRPAAKLLSLCLFFMTSGYKEWLFEQQFLKPPCLAPISSNVKVGVTESTKIFPHCDV